MYRHTDDTLRTHTIGLASQSTSWCAGAPIVVVRGCGRKSAHPPG